MMTCVPSLGIRPVWSEFLLSSWRRFAVHLQLPMKCREDSEQAGWMPRLIWVFPAHTGHFVLFCRAAAPFFVNPFHWQYFDHEKHKRSNHKPVSFYSEKIQGSKKSQSKRKLIHGRLNVLGKEIFSLSIYTQPPKQWNSFFKILKWATSWENLSYAICEQ